MEIYKLDEKIELAKALKLENLTLYFDSIKKMTDLKFSEISEDVIEECIKKQVKNSFQYIFLRRKAICGTIIFFLLPWLFYTIILIKSSTLSNGFGESDFLMTSLFFILSSALSLGASFDLFLDRLNIEIQKCNLGDWKYDIPYGALLATKEAEEKGLSNFNVWYPTFAKKSDPILTATDLNGKMYNIFEWDDKKIYST